MLDGQHARTIAAGGTRRGPDGPASRDTGAAVSAGQGESAPA